MTAHLFLSVTKTASILIIDDVEGGVYFINNTRINSKTEQSNNLSLEHLSIFLLVCQC